MSRYSRLIFVTTALTAVLITIGGLVRATGSGLGCPDWPRCYGSWVPPMEQTAIIEYSHRLSASIVGVLVLLTAAIAWMRYRRSPGIFYPALGALAVVLTQAWIGRLVVLGELPPNLVALHLFTSLVLLGLLTVCAVNSVILGPGRVDRDARAAAGVAGLVMLTVLVGAFVAQYRATLVFLDWPLMDGRIIPELSGMRLVNFAHRASALVTGAALIWLVVRLRRRAERPLKVLSHSAAGLWAVQVLIGAATVLSRGAEWAIVGHVAVGALVWAASVATTTAAYRLGTAGAPPQLQDEPAPRGSSMAGSVKAYFLLTKPRIIELLLITTLPAMVMAQRGWPPLDLILATLFGGTLAAGSANAINCWFDRDIDERMNRTRGRPLPARTVAPDRALVFGVLLGVVGFAWLAVLVNLTAAVIATGANLFYVFVYTLWMKRTTPSNIVIGGAAGAAPVLVGWAAVRGEVELPAWILFAIVFYWTPPHFWALAIRHSDEYRAAGVPMLPVVRGPQETARQMIYYAAVLIAVSCMLFAAGGAGLIYLASALLLGVSFVLSCVLLLRRPSDRRAMQVFHLSISYLVLLAVGVVADTLITAPAADGLRTPVAFASALVFVVFESLILRAVFGYRTKESPRGRFAAELAWTALPLMAAAAAVIAS